MNERDLDQMLCAANRQAQQAVAASLDTRRALAAVKAAAADSPVPADMTSTSRTPAPGPADDSAVLVIWLRLMAHEVDRELKAARDLARDLARDIVRIPAQDPRDRAPGSGLERFCNPFDARRVLFPHSRADTLDGALDRARGLALDLDRKLDAVLSLALSEARGIERRLSSVLSRTRALAAALPRIRSGDHRSPVTCDVVVSYHGDSAGIGWLGITSALDSTLDSLGIASDLYASSSTLHLSFSRGFVLGSGLGFDRAHASTIADALDRACAMSPISMLVSIEVDASEADLSHVAINDLSALEGVLWTARTKWPHGLANRIFAHSDEIRPGVYRVRGGSQREVAALPG